MMDRSPIAQGRRDRQLSFACFVFNSQPESGIAYLREQGLLTDEGAAGVAQFLHTAAGLSKRAIGDFLGRPDAFNQEVLTAFVRRYDFTDQPLLPSLRRLLGSFLLPGESQQIDRIVDRFAQHFCRQNSAKFSSADACAVLCYALLILNTALHNPNVHDKPPGVDRLVEMAHHCGQPILPRSQLQQLYDNIKLNPFEVPLDSGFDDLTLALRRPERSGWLMERRWVTGRCKHFCPWQRRWFVLLHSHLCFFVDRDAHLRDEKPIGVLPLVNLSMCVVQDSCKKFCFELRGKSGPILVSESGRGRRRGSKPLMVDACRLSAETSQDMVQWMLAIATKSAEQPAPLPVPRSELRIPEPAEGQSDSSGSWEYVY